MPDVDLNPQGRAPTPSVRPGRCARAFSRISVGRCVVSEPSKHEIEARAYRLWEQAGCPEDRDAEFWRLAEQQLRNDDKASPIRTPVTL